MRKRKSMAIVIMLLLTVFAGMLFVNTTSAAEHTVGDEKDFSNIQDAINASSPGDTIVVDPGTYTENILVNVSDLIITSVNGSADTIIMGSVNFSVNDIVFGGVGAGFTIIQETIDNPNIHAVNISYNASRDNITISFCVIEGGYDGIHIGRTGGTADVTSNLTLYNTVIRNVGRSAIRSGPGLLDNTTFEAVEAYNVSNTIYGDIICVDGGTRLTIQDCILYDTLSNGGMGINSTGLNDNHFMFSNISNNKIYDVDGYSPICIASQDATNATVAELRIVFNDLLNDGNEYSEPAIRFDNLSGLIAVKNITVMYNNIGTTGNAIEEQFGDPETYGNWSGVMRAYFNWYGADEPGSFRNEGHQIAEPRLHIETASSDIYAYTDYLEGTLTDAYINSSLNSKVNVSSITTTGWVAMVVYPYGGADECPVPTYPTRSMHNYKEIGVTDPSLVTYPVNITIFYDEDDLEVRGWAERHIYGLAWYNFSRGAWQLFNDTGVNTTDTNGYEGFAWANAWQESQLTGSVVGIVFDEIEVADPVTPTPPTPPDNDVVPPEYEPTYPEYLGIAWYWWILIALAIILIIMMLVFALSPKTWKRFKKKFK